MRSGFADRRLRLLVLLFLGVGTAVFLVWHSDPAEVIKSLLAIGLRGLLAAAAVHLAAVGVCAAAWLLLAADPLKRAAWRFFLLGRLMRDIGGEVLPLVPLGELLGIRQLMLAGISAPRATAITIADITVELATQFTLAGSLVALMLAAGLPAWRGLGGSAITGAGLPLLLVLLMQRSGGPALSSVLAGGSGLFARISGFGDRVAAALHRIYARRSRVAAAAATHVAGWVVGGLETWVVLRAGGVAIGMLPAVALEIAACGIRNVSPVPAGAGVQEGGYLLLGGFVGLAPESALALSLTRRGRTLVIAALLLPVWLQLPWRVRQSSGQVPESVLAAR